MRRTYDLAEEVDEAPSSVEIIDFRVERVSSRKTTICL
ncbi:hypothetical protein HRED_09917 [Candidatus Haloredivivus sp. G17]|nr:hypothetical protein HRED_09917 [Candidatus Haloredivivus sp. G17]